MTLIEDFTFFTFHYLMHQPILYPFHKVHHEYSTTVSIAGLHFHVIEFLLIQSLSTMINFKITMLFGPLHLSTVIIFVVLRIYDANNGHCGYNFSWTPLQILPFCANDEFHDFHHSRNSGNYGSQLRIWDSTFGTNREFRKHKMMEMKTELKQS